VGSKDLVREVGACLECQLLREDQRVIAVEQDGCDLVWSAFVGGVSNDGPIEIGMGTYFRHDCEVSRSSRSWTGIEMVVRVV
jgi:hypothetical protein